MPSKYLDKNGLARYDTKIKSYIADAVGTKKYRHNIFATWAGGSGSGHVHGCLSFNFVDTSSTRYGNGGSPVFNVDTFETFIKDHMGFTANEYNYYNAVGGYQVGAPVVTTGTIVGIECDGSASSWYMFVIGENQYGRYFEENYLTAFPNISGNYIAIYDRVETL